MEDEVGVEFEVKFIGFQSDLGEYVVDAVDDYFAVRVGMAFYCFKYVW